MELMPEYLQYFELKGMLNELIPFMAGSINKVILIEGLEIFFKKFAVADDCTDAGGIGSEAQWARASCS